MKNRKGRVSEAVFFLFRNIALIGRERPHKNLGFIFLDNSELLLGPLFFDNSEFTIKPYSSKCTIYSSYSDLPWKDRSSMN